MQRHGTTNSHAYKACALVHYVLGHSLGWGCDIDRLERNRDGNCIQKIRTPLNRSQDTSSNSLSYMIHAYMDRFNNSVERIQLDAGTLPSP